MLLLQLFILLFSPCELFPISVGWWSFIGVWGTASPLGFPRLFSVFWLISKLLSFGWSRFFLWSPTVPMLFRCSGDRSKCTNYNWYHLRPRIPQLFFLFSGKIRVFVQLFNIVLLIWEFFFTPVMVMVFQWSLSDSKSPKVSRTPLIILDGLNNADVWMVCSRPFISESFRYHVCQLQLVSPSFSCIVFSVLLPAFSTYLTFCFPSVLTCG